MSDYRAILVSEDEWREIDRTPDDYGWYDKTLDVLSTRWQAAGDQPRIRWCVTHNRAYSSPHIRSSANPCRVVDAIVVPLEDAL